MKTRVTINVERGVNYDWAFSDELSRAWDIPFIYFMHHNFVDIVSLLTNKIVRTIDFGPQLLRKINVQNSKLLKKISEKD